MKNDLKDNLKIQIFEAIKKEFKALECADELNTTQGKHELWTPADVALSDAYNEALKKVEKEFIPVQNVWIKVNGKTKTGMGHSGLRLADMFQGREKKKE